MKGDMDAVWYDESSDVLHIKFSDNPYKEIINTKVLTLYLDMNGNICGITIKNAKAQGIIDKLIKLSSDVSV